MSIVHLSCSWVLLIARFYAQENVWESSALWTCHKLTVSLVAASLGVNRDRKTVKRRLERHQLDGSHQRSVKKTPALKIAMMIQGEPHNRPTATRILHIFLYRTYVQSADDSQTFSWALQWVKLTNTIDTRSICREVRCVVTILYHRNKHSLNFAKKTGAAHRHGRSFAMSLFKKA